ncbi:MAG: hypothetical protein PT958_05420 [Firmicutes bacterium]|nr:hypothetical protein [Bacillota bacterium]MDY2719324.1 hypothetical protein [Candidatus Faecousia sp.]
MGMLSLLLAVAGIVTTLVHYSNHNIVVGVITAVLLVVSYILGTADMKKQEKNGGLKTQMFNPALLGHGMSSVVLIVCGIMCVIANVG